MVSFKKRLVAPCGIFCGACYAFLRDKNKCPGCRSDSKIKPKSCINCRKANCEYLVKSESGFCYECEQFPCAMIKQIDKRYRIKYNTHLINNLLFIKEKGIDNFLLLEQKRRTCNNCGSIISIHRNNCTNCGNKNS
jgi:hypothetical protein